MQAEQTPVSPKPVATISLIAGIAIFVLMTIALAAIAEDVHNNEPLTVTDFYFSNWLHAHRLPWLRNVLWAITSVHSSTVVSAVAFPLGLYLWYRRDRFWVAALWLSVYGGWALNLYLKSTFHRARPHFADAVQTLTSYSFPSGHAMISTVFYGTLAMFFISRHPRWPSRIVAAGIAILMILLVAFSRIYLGAHYLSDVVAAMAEGFAWVALSLTLLYYLRNRSLRRSSPVVVDDHSH